MVGETTVIGKYVKIYQGVTLGALSTRGGQSLRGVKRHPTLEDNVTVYSGASILGGETVIGTGAVIGSNAFITSSVPAQTRVSIKNPELEFKDRSRKASEAWSGRILQPQRRGLKKRSSIVKFFHIADTHLGAILDAGFAWSEERRSEIWESFRSVVAKADREEVDLLLIAGRSVSQTATDARAQRSQPSVFHAEKQKSCLS